MLKRPDSFDKNITNKINNSSSQAGQLDYFVVKDTDRHNRTISVQKLNSPISMNNVPMVYLGSINMPPINSLVVCGYIMNSETPVCFGRVRDTLSNENDKETNVVEDGEVISETKTKTNSTLIRQKNDGTVIIANSNGSFKLNPDGTLTINEAFTFPLVDGISGQVLKTDGSGNLTWQDDDTA